MGSDAVQKQQTSTRRSNMQRTIYCVVCKSKLRLSEARRQAQHTEMQRREQRTAADSAVRCSAAAALRTARSISLNNGYEFASAALPAAQPVCALRFEARQRLLDICTMK